MNTRLEQLFEIYNISEKDRHEINQFFFLLPDINKKNILNNFGNLAQSLKNISDNLEKEREILLPKSIDRVKSVLKQVKDERINLYKI